jgi:hypothetical protein
MARNAKKALSPCSKLLGAMVLGPLLFGLAPSAKAAPITVTYALSGGFSGGTNGVGTITGGSTTVRFRNFLLRPRSRFHGSSYASITTFKLTGTAGTFVASPNNSPYLGNLNPATYNLNPTGSIGGYAHTWTHELRVRPITPAGGIYTNLLSLRKEFAVATPFIGASGGFTGAGGKSGSSYTLLSCEYSTCYARRTGFVLNISWSGVSGREVSVPEPATSPLLGFGPLLTVVVGTGVRISSRGTRFR